MRFVFRTILFVFLSVIFISSPLSVHASVLNETVRNIGAFYAQSTSSLLDVVNDKISSVVHFYKPLVADTSRTIGSIYNGTYTVSDKILDGVIKLGDGVLDVSQYQINNTGYKLADASIALGVFAGHVQNTISTKTSEVIRDADTTVNQIVKKVAENMAVKSPSIESFPSSSEKVFDSQNRGVASADSAVTVFIPDLKKLKGKAVEGYTGLSKKTINTIEDVTKVVSQNIDEATVAMGEAGFQGVRNVFVLGTLVGNSVLHGSEKIITTTGDVIGGVAVKSGNIAFQTKKSIDDSLQAVGRNSFASVGSVFNFFIDKISDPLVPLFVRSNSVFEPIKATDTKKDNVINNISKNLSQSRNSSVTSGSVVEKVIEKPSYFTIDNSIEINRLRAEMISLNTNTINYLAERIALQGYHSTQGLSSTVTNIIQGNVSGSGSLTSVDVSAGTTGFSFSGGPVTTSGTITLGGILNIANGGTGTSTAPSYGQILLGNASGTYDLVSTSTLGIVSGGSGTVTSVGLSVPTGLTVSGGPVTTSGTLALGLQSGYMIPLSASTTEWDAAYTNRITSASGPLSITNNVISLSTAGDWAGTLDSHEGAYYLDANNLTNFGVPFYTYFSATTTDALSEGVTNKYFTDARVAGVIAGTTTSALAEGSNLYYTPARVASVIAGTTTDALAQGSTNKYYSSTLFNADFSSKTTDALTEGTTNKYFSNTLARDALSSGATGLTYNNSTGIFSLTSGYSIPLSASTTEWNSAYSNRITSASTPLSISGNAISIALAGTSQDGYLSSTDWNTFNDKVSSQWTTSGSNIYYTTGSAGVGTTSPSAKFAVTGSGATTGRALVVANSSNADRFVVNDSGDVSLGLNLTSTQSGTFNIVSQTGNIAIQPGGGGATYFYQQGIRLSDGTQGFNRPAANELGILSSGSERIRVASGGNIGIGSTTPWKKLSVAGDISLTGALYDSTASAGTSGYVLQSTGTGIQWVATSSLNISGGSSSQWTTSGSDIYYSTGKVGIGTSTPANPLVVSGYAHATLGLTVGGTSATTTGTRLSLIGGSLSSYSSSESTARWTIGNSAITNGVGGLVFDSTIGGQSATGGAIGQSVARTLSFYTSNGSTLTERATIDGSGNFGIGSTTPWGQLSINSNGITGPSFVVGSSTATKFIVTNGGNVGIGTASPTSALDVQGTYGSHLVVGKSGQAGIIYLRRGSDGAAAAYLGYIGASEGGSLSLTSGGGAGSITLNASGGSVSVVAANTAHSVFHSNGNLGVGSTTPWKKLSVAGDISLTGALYDSTASAGTSGYVLQSTGTGIQWVATSSLNISGGSSSQWTTSGSDIYYSTGSVGVGTSTPWAQFSINPNGISGPAFVVGSSTATKFVVSNAGKVGIGLTSPSTLLHISGANSANEVEYLRFSSSNTAAQGDELSTYWYAGNSNTKLAKLSVYNEGSSKAGFRFGVTSDGGSTVPNKMVLTGDGYLGVGTANTPAATLNLSKTNSIAGSEWELMRYTLTGNSFTGDEISSYWYTQGTSHKLAKMSVINEGGGKAGFRFGTTNDGAVTTPNRVAITGDGRLGVGLVNPQTTLEVQGTASTSALYIPTTQSATIGTLNLGGNRFLHGYTTASTFVGPNSGNFTTTGTYNTGIGSSALSTVTSGHTNVAVGASALAGVTTGARNVGIGYLAIGSGSGGGTDNIAIGYGAISASSLSGNYNTVLGSWAGRALTSASNSVMVGYGAGYSNSTGANNVFVGYNSGYNTTGGSNIMIGYQAGNNLVAGTNNIIIGYDIDATSTTMTKGLNIGNLLFGTGLDGSATTLSTGNIGIGTTTPWAKFSVDSSSLGTSPALVVGSSTATSMIITNGGLMGVGTASPAFPIDVAVTVDSNQTYGYLNPAGAIGTSAGTNSYSIRATGRIIASEFNAVSDARLKDVQFNLDSKMALDAITKLQPVSFTWKDNPNGQPVLGLLAQEVELAIPNAVSKLQTDKFSDQREVSYNQIVAVMIGAIKEIKSQINDISSKISNISSWFVDDKLRIQNDICVDDVCVSKQEFKQLLLNNGASHITVQAPNPNTTSDNGSDTSTATTTNNSISSETASTTQTSNTNTSTSTSISDTSTVTEVTQTAPEPSGETETPASSPVIEQVPQPSVSESTENSGSQESVQ